MAGPVPLSRRNVAALDGIRGLAILSVMCNHAILPPFSGKAGDPLQPLFAHGWIGVDLFFVLSGFLITGILVDTRESTNYFGSFYARRALRIFPLYYSFLALAWLVFPRVVQADWLPMRADWWLYPTYLMNWQGLWKDVWHANIVGHFWSLAVEEQFYFLWPLAVLAIPRRRLLSAVAMAEVAVIGGRFWWLSAHGASIPVYTATITRMDGLLLGAACAVAVREFRFPRQAIGLMPWAAALFLGGYLVMAQDSGAGEMGFNQSTGFVLLAMGFAELVLYAVLTDGEGNWLQSALRWKGLTRVGKYAYGIYVFHVPIFYFVNQAVWSLPRGMGAVWVQLVQIPIEFGLSFGLASASYNFFEKKILAYKDRFEPEYAVDAAAVGPAVGQAAGD